MGVSRKGLVYGNGYNNKKTQAENVTTLMANSYQYDPRISIELDAHFAPASFSLNHGLDIKDAYVMHDVPKWQKSRMRNPVVIQFLKDNTLKDVLDFHVKNNAHKRSIVYIELKSKKKCYKDLPEINSCFDQCKGLASIIVPYLKDHTEKNWLAVTSFSPNMLVNFRAALPAELKDRVDYILIAGHRIKGLTRPFVSLKGYVPKFGKNIKSFASSTPWIDCIWFSVQGIKNYTKHFNEVIDNRKGQLPGATELRFSFATYPLKRDKMIEKLIGDTVLNAPFRSFMLDLDYKIE